jgi:hypothetical protein
MFLGASGLKRAVLLLGVLVLTSFSLLGCFLKNSVNIKKPPSGAVERVMASQSATAGNVFGGVFTVQINQNDQDGNDVLAHVPEISAGTGPGLMAISPTRATLLAFDTVTNTVEIIDTTTEKNTGSIRLPGPTTSIALPPTTGVGYAAVPTTTITGYAPGAIEIMNLTNSTIPQIIGVPDVQTVVSVGTGTQLLAFNQFADPAMADSIFVISPLAAVGPVDQGCDNLAASTACQIVQGFDRPVYAVVNGTMAYVFNCGPECGGTQASVQTLDMSTTPPTVGLPLPLPAATYGFLNGNTLYVAGTPPGNNTCAGGPTTLALTCGRLSVVDVSSMTVMNTSPIYIPDGYHDRMDLGQAGAQLFVGSQHCTNIGNINNPNGEVRGCLAIYDTTKPGNTTAIIPQDNGDVTGLQGFSTVYQEFVAEGGNLRVYNTTTDQLLINDTVTNGTIGIGGIVIDVKAVDFF